MWTDQYTHCYKSRNDASICLIGTIRSGGRGERLYPKVKGQLCDYSDFGQARGISRDFVGRRSGGTGQS